MFFYCPSLWFFDDKLKWKPIDHLDKLLLVTAVTADIEEGNSQVITGRDWRFLMDWTTGPSCLSHFPSNPQINNLILAISIYINAHITYIWSNEIDYLCTFIPRVLYKYRWNYEHVIRLMSIIFTSECETYMHLYLGYARWMPFQFVRLVLYNCIVLATMLL